MAHEVYDGKVLSFRQPMWHHLGQVIEDEVNATEAYNRIGQYKVDLVPVRLDNGFDTGQRAIVRDYGTAKQYVFGMVKGEYHLVTPEDICEAWDAAVARNVETMGALREGSVFFVSTGLGKRDIRGDEITEYLLLTSPMSGMESIQALATSVRTVCMNTLIAAKSASRLTFNIPHNKYAKDRTKQWLEYLIARSESQFETQREAYERFAMHSPTEDQVSQVLEETYPLPEAHIRGIVDEKTRAQREKWNEEYRRAAMGARDRTRNLFEGAGTGMDVEAAKGTFWGLYNAVTEDRDWGMCG
jgi:phage/plasmid-like protein (TIGR03299 family)